MSEQRSLVERMAAAAARMGAVEKGGTNKHFGYDYATHNDVSAMVRKPLFDEGVILLLDIDEHTWEDGKTSKGKPKRTHTVKFTAHFHGGGETISCKWIGQSEDSDDKGVGKAMSSGVKTLMLKMFLIPADDPANDIEHSRHDANRNAPPPSWNDLETKQQQHYAIRRKELAAKIAWPDRYPNGYDDWIKKADILRVDPKTGNPSFSVSYVHQIERVIQFLEKQARENPKPEPASKVPANGKTGEQTKQPEAVNSGQNGETRTAQPDDLAVRIEQMEARLSCEDEYDKRVPWLTREVQAAKTCLANEARPADSLGPVSEDGTPQFDKWSESQLKNWLSWLERPADEKVPF